jgi:hypothetical protein
VLQLFRCDCQQWSGSRPQQWKHLKRWRALLFYLFCITTTTIIIIILVIIIIINVFMAVATKTRSIASQWRSPKRILHRDGDLEDQFSAMATNQVSEGGSPRLVSVNDPSARKYKLIQTLIAAVLLSAALVLVSYAALLTFGPIFLITNDDRQSQCELVDELTLSHLVNEQEQIRVPSDDFRTLVKFAGAIKYFDQAAAVDQRQNGTTTTSNSSSSSRPSAGHADWHQDGAERPRAPASHLALKLMSVELKPNGSNGEQLLVLRTNCARITLQLASDTRQLLVSSIELETVPVGEQQPWHACQISSTNIRLDDVATRRYSLCPRFRQQYECQRAIWRNPTTLIQKPVAQLHIHSFEFELDGKPKLIRQNKFSKPRMDCDKR